VLNLEGTIGEGEGIRGLPEHARKYAFSQSSSALLILVAVLSIAAVDKDVFLARVPVEIAVHGHLTILAKAFEHQLGVKDCGVQGAGGLQPLSV